MSSLYPARRRAPETYTTEFDILKASHKFLRSAEEDVTKSWEAQLAKKYEDSLFKEFAVCDLKHYKSGNVALRWRTEDEVLSGAGEETCGNTRCPHHDPPSGATPNNSKDARNMAKSPKLTTLELPFSYAEQGESQVRQVMVKVVVCERCVKKLMWKREKDKKDRSEALKRSSPEELTKTSEQELSIVNESMKEKYKEKSRGNAKRSGNGNRSRSRSPRRHREPY